MKAFRYQLGLVTYLDARGWKLSFSFRTDIFPYRRSDCIARCSLLLQTPVQDSNQPISNQVDRIGSDSPQNGGAEMISVCKQGQIRRTGEKVLS
jgi:hypothetical protein